MVSNIPGVAESYDEGGNCGGLDAPASHSSLTIAGGGLGVLYMVAQANLCIVMFVCCNGLLAHRLDQLFMIEQSTHLLQWQFTRQGERP